MTRRHAPFAALLLGASLASLVPVFGPGVAAQPPAEPKKSDTPEGDARPRRVVKTDEEWIKLLTPDQYMVTRRKATEAPFSGKYAGNHAAGTYACVCCGTPLFSSKTKFESGTGWPSFFMPIDPRTIAQAADNELGEPRVEVKCSVCDAHLGHVFNDGPAPTGLRFCINSASLKFKPASATGAPAAESKAAKSKAKPRTRAKSKATPKADPAPAGDDKPKAP